jgi:hypothetical protein
VILNQPIFIGAGEYMKVNGHMTNRNGIGYERYRSGGYIPRRIQGWQSPWKRYIQKVSPFLYILCSKQNTYRKDGEYYDGDWKDGFKEGYGKWENANHDFYEGKHK